MFAKQLLLLRGDPLFETVTHGGRKLASKRGGAAVLLGVALVACVAGAGVLFVWNCRSFSMEGSSGTLIQ